MVTTKYGKIEGVVTDAAQVYYGIPYAKAPVGELRFKAPEEPLSWDGVLDATKLPNRAPQKEIGPGLYKKEFYDYELPAMSEDCLYLNVWTPLDAEPGKKYPVAFWIHGGGYGGGYSAEKEFDGLAYAKKGVIMVSINYRLGWLGFFSHPELDKEDGSSGNYGMQDQIAAFHWVEENIDAFGGDPENITVFGQSAGAMSVMSLLVSPLTRDHIAKAIIQSGGGYKTLMSVGHSKRTLQKLLIAFMKEKGLCLDQVKTMPWQQIVEYQEAFGKYMEQHHAPAFTIGPVIDPYVLPVKQDVWVKTGLMPNIPYMIGYTTDDFGAGEFMEKGVHGFVQKMHKLCRKVHMYHFAHRLPGDEAGAFHSAELWYMFGTLDKCWRPMKQADYQLSEEMVDAWVNFIKTGNPGWETEIKVFDCK